MTTKFNRSFKDSIELQRLEAHRVELSAKGFDGLEDRTGNNQKLHDLYCPKTDTWFECKTDFSRYTQRLLIEYKANVPLKLVEHVPFRKPLTPQQTNSLVLADKYNALATDVENLKPRHLLSYYWQESGQHVLLDIAQLRREIVEKEYPLIVVGYEGEPWRTVAVLVPLSP